MNRKVRGSLINAERQELDADLTEALGLSSNRVAEIEGSSEDFWNFKVHHTDGFFDFMERYDTALRDHPDNERFVMDDSDEAFADFALFNRNFLEVELEREDSLYKEFFFGENKAVLRRRLEATLFWGNSDEYEVRSDLEGFLYTLQGNLKEYWATTERDDYDHRSLLCELAVECPSLVFTKFDADSIPLFLDADEDTRFAIADAVLQAIESGNYGAMSQTAWMIVFFYVSGNPSHHPEFAAKIKKGDFDEFLIESVSVLIGSNSPSAKMITQGWFDSLLHKWFDHFRDNDSLASLDSPIWTTLIKIFGGKNRLPGKIKTYRGRLVSAKSKGSKQVKSRSGKVRRRVDSATTPKAETSSDEGGKAPTPRSETDQGTEEAPQLEPVFMAPTDFEFSVSDDFTGFSFSHGELSEGLTLRIYVAEVSRGGNPSNATPINVAAGQDLDLSGLRADKGDRIDILAIATNQRGMGSKQVLSLGEGQAFRTRINFQQLEADKQAAEAAALREAEQAEKDKWELVEAGVVSFSGHRNIELVNDEGLMKLQFDESLSEDIDLKPEDLPFEIMFARNQDGSIQIQSFFGVDGYEPQHAEAVFEFLDTEASAFESFEALGMLGDLHAENGEMAMSLDMILSSPELRPKMALYWQEAFGTEAAGHLLERIKLHLSPAYEFEFTGDEEEIETIKIAHESGQFLEVYCGRRSDRLFKIVDQKFDDHRLRVVLAELAKMILSSLAHQALSADEKEQAEANNENLRGKKEDAIKALNFRSGRGFRGRFAKPEKNLRWAEALQREETIVLVRSHLNISRVDSTRSIGYSEDQYLRLSEALKVPNFRQYLWRRIIDTYAKGVAELPPTYKPSGATTIERPELKKGIMVGARRVFSPDELGKVLAGDIRTRDLVDKEYQGHNALDLFIGFMQECEVGITVSDDITLGAQDLFTFAKREGLEVVF